MNSENTIKNDEIPQRLPQWLRVKTGKARLCAQTCDLVERYGLQTVCQNARCPNRGECYSDSTATFMIMGKICTRDCGFCAVEHGTPKPLDTDEPRRLAEAARELQLDYVVVTSVTRDDLPDGGAAHFAATIRAVREIAGAQIEVLPSDLQGDTAALMTILEAEPTVFNHNVETVRRLTSIVRPQADYDRSLAMLRTATERAPHIPRKSGLMVGLGETDEEIEHTLCDLQEAGCQIVTIGQYLRPTPRHLPVHRYPTPQHFQQLAEIGHQAGITHVVSGPFVRSSYRAAETARAVMAAGKAI